MFLSSVSYVSTLNSSALNDNFTDGMLSVVLSAILSIILSLPVFFLHDKFDDFNAPSLIRRYTKNIAPIIFALFIMYFLLCDVLMLSLMIDLLVSTVFPSVSPLLIAVMVLIVAAYGSYKGIESVARVSLIVLVCAIVGALLVFIGLIDLISWEHRQVLLYDGYHDMLGSVPMFFVRSSFLPQTLFLLSHVKGKTVKKSILTNSLSGVLVISVLFLIVNCLGLFAGTQLFPVYTLSTVSQILPIQRLDIVFVLAWFMILVVKIASDFISAGECIKLSVKNKYNGVIQIIFAVIVLFATAILTFNMEIKHFLVTPVLTGIFIVLFGVLLPLVLLISFRRKKA